MEEITVWKVVRTTKEAEDYIASFKATYTVIDCSIYEGTTYLEVSITYLKPTH